MANLEGKFQVINKSGKFRIYYMENTTMILCSKKRFDEEVDALSYITNHREQLEEYVSGIFKTQQDKEDAKVQKEAAKTVKKVQKEEQKALKKAEKEKNKELRKTKRNRFIAGLLAATTFLVGGHFIWAGIARLAEKNGKNPSASQSDSTKPSESTKNEPTVPSTTPVESDELTDEKFEEVAAEFGKVINDAGINLETDDIVEFASIINIDKLCKDNYELAQELFGVQTKEEYLNETFKVLGQISQYNFDLYFTSDTKGTTEGFIRVSDVVSGEKEKETIKYYESLVDAMAIAANEKNADEVNRIAEEFCNSINDPTSPYSAVSDGIGLGLYSSINAMLNIVSRDVDGICYLSEVNTEKLVILSSCEKYISNIFRKYEGCAVTTTYAYAYEDTTTEVETLSCECDNLYTSYTRGRRL